MTEVEMPDGTILEFPDGMSQDQIKGVLRKRFPVEPNTNVPPEMVFDPERNQYVDTSLRAERLGSGMGAVATAAAGFPFVGSYFDELQGVAGGPVAQETARQSRQQFEENNPKTAAALKLGTGIASTLPYAAAAAPAFADAAATTLGGKAMQAAAFGGVAGAVEGGVYGAGEGREGERLAEAAEGATFGGLAGGVLGAAAPYAATGIKEVLLKLKSSDVNVISSALGVSPNAARVVKAALDRGDITEAENLLRRAGDDAMLADAGQPARELLDAVSTSGGQAGAIVRKAVDERVDKSSKDVSDALDTYLGKPQGVNTSRGAIRDETEIARQTAYDRAYSSPIDYSSGGGESLSRLLGRVPQSAISKANELMRLEGVKSRQILAEVADDGSVTFSRLPDVRQLDYITRALNDVADAADGQGKLGGTTATGRATKGLSRAIRNTTRKLVPEYGEALDVAADAISRSKAIETGSKLLNAQTTREQVRESLKGASKAEKEAMKQGVRDGIDDMLANVQGVISDPDTDAREALRLLRAVSSRSNREKLAMVLGPRPAAALAAELDKAATTFELRAAIAQNSKTAIRQAIQGTIEQRTAPGVLETLAGGEPANAGKRFIQIMTGASDEAKALKSAGIYEDIATALTGVRGTEAAKALRTVRMAMKGHEVTEEAAARVGRVLSTTLAASGSREGTRRLSTE